MPFPRHPPLTSHSLWRHSHPAGTPLSAAPHHPARPLRAPVENPCSYTTQLYVYRLSSKANKQCINLTNTNFIFIIIWVQSIHPFYPAILNESVTKGNNAYAKFYLGVFSLTFLVLKWSCIIDAALLKCISYYIYSCFR